MSNDLNDLLRLKHLETPDAGADRVAAVHSRITKVQHRRVALTITGSAMAIAIVVAFVVTSFDGKTAAPQPRIPATVAPTVFPSTQAVIPTTSPSSAASGAATVAAISSWSQLPGGTQLGTGGFDAYVQGKIVTAHAGCCGSPDGDDEHGNPAPLTAIDPATLATSELPAFPGTPRQGEITLATSNGMYVLGGSTSPPHATGLARDVWHLDVASKRWTSVAALPDSPGKWDPLESTCRHASLSIL